MISAVNNRTELITVIASDREASRREKKQSQPLRSLPCGNTKGEHFATLRDATA
ncbi:hypothetical protein [Nostoc sp.]|uniref:hypothetical protein n=1 Tax=Nostoc sp. TaxID=1180 RepID=UPI002FF9B8D6